MTAELTNAHLDVKDRRLRQDAAVALKVAGASYEEIAQTLDYGSVGHARQAVERALASTVDAFDREKERGLANRRIERLLRGLWAKAADPDHPEHLVAARTAMVMVDRHIRLNGLDAPTEVTVYTPAAREIETWVATVMAHQKSTLPIEADVLDAEVVE